MNIGRLVMMANQIAAFYRRKPQAEAAEAIADHLRKYWDPRMRSTIIAHAQSGGAGLEPATLAAIRALHIDEHA